MRQGQHKFVLITVLLCLILFNLLWNIGNKNGKRSSLFGYLWGCKPSDSKRPTLSAPESSISCEIPKDVDRGTNICKLPYGIPKCPNIEKKIVVGKWVEKKSLEIEKEKNYLDDMLSDFRSYHEGFSEKPFRSDGRCGFKYSPQFNICNGMKTQDASAWCDPLSDKPCCSDRMAGQCVAESSCNSPNSVNLAKYVHAEVSEWVPDDVDCRMVLYTQETACSLLHDMNVRSIGFIGNSLLQNMYAVMLQLLQNNFYNGTVKACVQPSLRKKCVNQLQNLDKYCLDQAMANPSRILSGNGLCNGYGDILLFQKSYYNADHGKEFKQYVESVLDKPGTYILVGIGVHDGHNSQLVKEKYLKPTFEILREHEWPKFIWIHPLKNGVFKPAASVSVHGSDEKIDEFVKEIEEFCSLYDVPTIDFRGITTGVWSADGTHYGTGVNLMKLQIFFNFLASNEIF